MNKLTLLHINIIGAVVVLIVGAALYFTVISGATDAKQKAEADYNQVHDRAVKLDEHKRLKQKAEKARADAIKEYAVFDRSIMPTFGYTNNRLNDMEHIWWPNRGRSWPERFIRGVRSFMAQESRRNGIRWDNPEILALPSYGADPNTIDMGDNDRTWRSPVYQINVTGRNMASILRHVQDWNNLNGYGVPVIDNLTLAGNSPELQASYTLQFTAILHDTEKPAPKNLRISGSGGGNNGGGGGGMGRMMGGGGPSGSAGMSQRGGGGGKLSE